MDCVISRWHQCPASLGDGPSYCHTYRRIFSSSALWNASGQSIWSSAWLGTSFPGPGHCRQTGILIWPAASMPHLVLSWATLLDPGGSVPPGSSLSDSFRFSQGPHWENHQWHLVGWSDFSSHHFGGITMGWVLRFLRLIGTQEEPGVTLHMWWLVQWRQAAWDPMLAQQACGPTYSALGCLSCH